MRLIPNRAGVERLDRMAAARGADIGARPRTPLAPLRRLVVFVVAFVILHGFCLFAVAQIARHHPMIFTEHPGVTSLLCGDGTKLETDFRPRAMGGSRSLDRWIVCRDGDGHVIEEAGQIAAWLAPLVLSVPLGMVLFGWAMRTGRGHRHGMAPVSTSTRRPARWFDRLLLSMAALLVAAVFAGAFGAYVTHYHVDTIANSPMAGRLLCGKDRIARVTNPYSRARSIGCFEADGGAVVESNPGAFLRLILPAFLLVALPGLLLALRAPLVVIATTRRRRRA